MVAALGRADANNPVLRNTLGCETTDQTIAQKRLRRGAKCLTTIFDPVTVRSSFDQTASTSSDICRSC